MGWWVAVGESKREYFWKLYTQLVENNAVVNDDDDGSDDDDAAVDVDEIIIYYSRVCIFLLF